MAHELQIEKLPFEIILINHNGFMKLDLFHKHQQGTLNVDWETPRGPKFLLKRPRAHFDESNPAVGTPHHSTGIPYFCFNSEIH